MRRAVSLSVLSLAAASPAAAQRTTWALTNARIETASPAGVIERGTIVIRDGLIAAVGASVTVPPDARVVDLAGRTVYPGLIDLTSSLGLPAAPAARGGGFGGGGGGGGQEATGPVGLEPQRMVADELKPSAADVRAARDAGITAVLIAPTRGAFRGQSVLLPLLDSVAATDAVRAPVALHMGFQGVPGRYPATLLGVIAYERQALYDAQRHGLLVERYRANPRGLERPANDPALDALVPAVRGAMPVFFAADNENEIRRALSIGREFGLDLIVVGATEGFRAVDALTAARKPVVVALDFPRSPQVSGWAYRQSRRRAPNDSAAADSAVRKALEGNAAALHRAGVRVALASGGVRPAEFLGNVRKAIAAGLPRATALEAVTIRAAEVAGAARQLGSIETGKIANLVVSEGDLLGDSAKVRQVFVDGERYEVIAPPAGRGRGAGGGGGGGGAPAQVAGTWDVTSQSAQGANTGVLTVTQDGAALRGTMTGQFGSAELENGEVSGRTVRWSVSLTFGGQSFTITYEGEVDGTRMSGTANLGSFGSATFTAEKRP
jgi:imidazolonepropionase-like amidohydrolase